MSESKHAPGVLPQITKTQVMLALELVPTDMSHQEKCQWIADALNKSAAPAPVAQTNTDRALGALRAMRSKDAIAHRERMANAPKGACESCYGDGEIGGQFCGGFEPCAECGGTGRANGGEATGQEDKTAAGRPPAST